MRNINLTLSTSEANNHIGQVVIRQDDDNTQKIIADITENGKPKNLAGLTVFFNAMIDNTIIARDLATIEDSSKVSYALKSAFYQREGRIKAFFTFERGNQRESTANFVYFVTRGTCRNIKQGNYIYEFENLKGVVGDIIGSGDLLPLIKRIDEVQGSVDSYRIETNNKMSTIETKTNNKITTVENDLSQKIDKHEKRTDNPHKVTAEQVDAYDKKSTNNKINELIENKKLKAKDIYYDSEDGRYFDDTNTFYYNLNSNQEFFKLKMLWSVSDADGDKKANNFGYQSFEYDFYNFRGGSHYVPLFVTNGTVAIKQIYIDGTRITGHERNYTDEKCKMFKLRRVVVYYYEK